MPGCGGAAARWTAGRCTGRRPRAWMLGWPSAAWCSARAGGWPASVGPALVNAAAGLSQALIFVAAMVAGMALFSALEYLKHRQ